MAMGRVNNGCPLVPGICGMVAKPNGEGCAAGRLSVRAVGDGAKIPPPMAAIGTGALTSVVVVRRFKGIPKLAAFWRIAAPGESAMFPKVAGEAGALAKTAAGIFCPGDICTFCPGDICIGTCFTTMGLGMLAPTTTLTPGDGGGLLTAMTERTPGKAPGLIGWALARIIVVGFGEGPPLGIPKALVPATWTAGVAGDHGEPQGEPTEYVEPAYGE